MSKALLCNTTLTSLNLSDNALDDSCVHALAMAVGRTKAVVDLRYDINDLNFENSHMLSELLTHNKARYDAAATVRLSNGIAKRWHVMTTLPRLQMLEGEEKTLGSDVRRQLGEVKMERVVVMESS